MVFQPPRRFNRSEINNFLISSAFIFKSCGKKENRFVLDLSKIKEISLFGQLLIYKFISYTARNACFFEPKILWHQDRRIENEFIRSGFQTILNSYIAYPKDRKRIEQSYKKFKSVSENNYFFAPHCLIRNQAESRNQIEQEFIDGVTTFYASKKCVSVVALCISELIMNFWSHATDDSDTVLVARGGKKYFELFFADNAQGIVTTLKKSNKDYRKKSNMDVLEIACQKRVSSKGNTFHQGYGLYLVSELAKNNHGVFSIYSEGAQIHHLESKVRKGEAGYWKGTIIHLKLELSEPKTIKDLLLDPIDTRLNWG